MLVLFLFLCSGATALIYEVLWSKYLSLMLGSTVQAQTVVLAVFMGGLAIGNRLFGGRARLFREPLAVYGYLEIAIGIFAFVFHALYFAADKFFIIAGSALSATGTLLLVLKLAISVVLLIVPTVMMGGTLPLLAAWIQRQPGLDSAARVGIFYATNSIGAVLGAGLAGFYLVQTLGMVASLQITALANTLIGLAAIVLSKRSLARLSGDAEPVVARPQEAGSGRTGWFGLLVAITGGVSMGMEVIAARALVLIVGGSLQAFALVLMSFILGIGLGSAVLSSARLARRYSVWTIYVLLTAAAVLIVLNVSLIEDFAIAFVNAKHGLAPNAIGFIFHQISIALVSFLVLGLPAAFLGAVVPLSIGLLEKEPGELSEKVGRLLTWNTLGAVCGVLLTGFVLMPLLGLRPALVTIAMLLFGVVMVIAFRNGDRNVAGVVGVLIVVSSVVIWQTGREWKDVLSAGVFRVRAKLNHESIQKWKATRELIYYKDAADATVSVEKNLTTVPQLSLRVNGKPDASSYGDMSSQLLVGHLPMIAKPDAKDVFILGFGSGITGGAVLAHPIDRLTIAENTKPVLEAGQFFAQWNRGVLTNERVTIRTDDARAVLKLEKKTYDVIISQPSNPWVAGVANVFTQEFIKLAASRLNPGGLMAQWFHQYEMSDEIVLLVLRTFASVFPHIEMWDTHQGDLVLLGSFEPWKSDLEHYARIYERPLVRQDLESIHMPTPELLWARQAASQRTAFAIPGDGPIQTDEFPLLEYSAPRAFFVAERSTILTSFDERTSQFPLAPTNKLAVLRNLSPEALRQAFRVYLSYNDDIPRYIAAAAADTNRLPGLVPLQMYAFRDPGSYPENLAAPTEASATFKELFRLEASLLRHPENWRQDIERIETLLQRVIAEGNLKPDFLPAYYPAMAAKFAMGNGDYLLALRLLRLGFVLSPEDRQLAYLSRVLDRLLPPEMMREFKAPETAAVRQ